MKNRAIRSIEICRFVSCIMVVFIHCPFPGQWGGYIGAMGCYAVPFFLMVSGYFTDFDNPSHIRYKLAETIRIIACAGIICLVWNSVNSFLKTGSFTGWFMEYANLPTLVRFIVFNRAVFFNSTFYYLFMMVYIYLFCLLLSRHSSHNYTGLCWFAPALYVCGYVLFHFMGKAWYYSGNALCTGLPLFFFGHFLRVKPKLHHYLHGLELSCIFLGILITLGELKHLPQTGYTYIGQVIIAACLLCFCAVSDVRKTGITDFLASLGNKCSLYIMLFHCEIRDSLAIFFNQATILFPIIVLALSLMLALCVSNCANRLNPAGRRSSAR